MPQTFFINIGNTHSQFATLNEAGVPVLRAQYDTPALKFIGRVPLLDECPKDWQAVASSVVPDITDILVKTYGNAIRILTYRDFPQLDFSLIDTRTLGIDRICTIAGARSVIPTGPVIIVDCGTCIVTNVLDANNRFLGGSIMPGRMMQRKALANYTGALPCIPLQNALPDAIGNNTHNAILAGVDRGIIEAVSGILDQQRKLLNGATCTILATGGDAQYFANAIPSLGLAPDYLTLRGTTLAVRS